MAKHTYYYLEDSSGYVVVTSISRYGKINDYEHKALKKPHLFATEEEAKNTIEKSKGMSYYYRDADGKKHNCFMFWTIKWFTIII